MKTGASDPLFALPIGTPLDMVRIGSLLVTAWAAGTNASVFPDRKVAMEAVADRLGTAPDDVRRLLHVGPHADGIEIAGYDLCMAGAWRDGLIEMHGIDLIRRIDRREAKSSLDTLTKGRPDLKAWLRSTAKLMVAAD